MTSREKLEELKTQFGQLVIYDNTHAMLPVGIDAELHINTDKPVKEWNFRSKKEKQDIPVLALTELMKTTRLDVVGVWKDIEDRESEKKEPPKNTSLDNLSQSGFDLSNVPNCTDSTPEEKPQKRELTDEEKYMEALVIENQKKEQEEKARLAREENKKLLDDFEASQARNEQEKPPQKNNFQKPAQTEQSYYSQPEDKLETAPTPKKGEVKLLDIIYDLVEDDLVQFFGKTGTCKTSIAIQAALEARKEGKSVYYLDTEKNISRKKKTAMKSAGVIYTPYTPSNQTGEFRTINDLIALHDFIKKIQRVDLLVIDSLGLPMLSVFCEGNQKDQGLTLQRMILVSKYLKSYANKNKSLVIVINQPESDMNKDPKTVRRSFGDKSEFFYKELLNTFFVSKDEKETKVVVKTFRSRDYGQGYPLFTISVTADGMKVIQ